jgi:hypothetical protein
MSASGRLITIISADNVLFKKIFLGTISSSEYKSKTNVITELLYQISKAEIPDLSTLVGLVFEALNPTAMSSIKLDLKLVLDLIPAYTISNV